MRKRKNDDLIYNTAIKYFAKYGYKKTTIEDIAAALDMSNSNIYSYASSKQALYYDSISYAVDKWQECVRNAVEGISSPTERLVVSFEAAIRYIDSNKDVKDLLRNDPSIFPMFPTVDPIEEFNNWSVDYITDILKSGVETGVFKEIDIEKTATILFNVYKYFIISTYVNPNDNGIDLKGESKEVLDILMHGLMK